MGAGQSTSSGDGSQSTAQEVKTSYYELLGIDKSATDDDIKKAYRRKALSLHPDRNFGQEEAATTQFAAVQTAYEILSDPQERAWYDSHEEAILRDIDPTAAAADGGQSYETSVGLTTADDITRLVRKFHGGIDFTDSPSGFFGFLREFFEQLVKEEEQAARRQNQDVPDYPSFGHKHDSHEDGVRQFYGAWAAFSTVKSFAWRDKYRMSDAEDRRMRRVIEKENMRFRREGMQEFNDAVRSLVAFVRKRDPRYKQTTQTEAERQRVLQDASKAQAARMRAANEEKMQGVDAVPEWARVREPEETLGKGVEEGTFEESGSEEEHFECVACRKVFKSEKQYEAHERSNKHKKAVQALRRKLEKDGHRVGLEDDDDDGDGDGDGDNNELEDQVNPMSDANPPRTLDSDNDPSEESNAETSTDNRDEDLENLSTTLQDTQLDNMSDSSSTTTTTNTTPPTTHSTITSPDPAPSEQPKKGKAAQKRSKKAAKAAAAAESTTDLKNKCAVCAAAFPSKTRLFQHIRDHDHAAPVPQGRYKKPGGAAGKPKKKG